jgi:hypothetical protein
VRDYLLALESHLSEAHRQAARLTAKEVELGEAVLEFGQVSSSRFGPAEYSRRVFQVSTWMLGNYICVPVCGAFLQGTYWFGTCCVQ